MMAQNKVQVFERICGRTLFVKKCRISLIPDKQSVRKNKRPEIFKRPLITFHCSQFLLWSEL